MDKLVLAKLQALAASPDYAGNTLLAASSAVLGLSAAYFLSDLELWQGASYSLTDGEIDDIKAMIAQLENDLMLAVDMYPTDKVKVTHSDPQSIPPTVTTNVFFDTTIYDPQDMHDDIVDNYKIHIINDGLHLVSGQILIASGSFGDCSLTLWRFDSSTQSTSAVGSAKFVMLPTVGAMPLNIFIQGVANVGDWYKLTVNQFSLFDITIYNSAISPLFAAVRL